MERSVHGQIVCRGKSRPGEGEGGGVEMSLN
jgi:hypothetical protein